MAEEAKAIEYTKITTTGMNQSPEGAISFFEKPYKVLKRMKMSSDESEWVGITDINKYSLPVIK